MKPFLYFPAKMDYTPIPNLFLSRLLPQIDDMTELITTLYTFMSIYKKRGFPRFVSFGELLGNVSLVQSLKRIDNSTEVILDNALVLAVKRGTLLHLPTDTKAKEADLYFLNTQSNIKVIKRIQTGELKLPNFISKPQRIPQIENQPDIFTLYEENIGMLTPMIAEELKDAEKLYPNSWIRDAIKLAINQNKRKWNYISSILERWSTEGKDNGAYRRDTEKEDPNKYVKGRYGHMVRRR